MSIQGKEASFQTVLPFQAQQPQLIFTTTASVSDPTILALGLPSSKPHQLVIFLPTSQQRPTHHHHQWPFLAGFHASPSSPPTREEKAQFVVHVDGGGSGFQEEGVLEFLSGKGKVLINSIVEHPLSDLDVFLDYAKDEVFHVDLVSLLEGLEFSGDWEKTLVVFKWVVSNSSLDNRHRLDDHAIEVIVRALGRESQHSIASNLFDIIPLEEHCLDIRAYTMILHAFAQTGKYDRAITLIHQIKQKGLTPTLVTYNVVLDVYRKMGRSWNKMVAILDEMKSKDQEVDEFTCGIVISACGRDGLLDRACEFFDDTRARGYVPRVVTYNSLLHIFGKAGNLSKALILMKEMEERGCTPDSVTYNELVAVYTRAGLFEEAPRAS